MVEKNSMLRPIGSWLIVGALLTILASVFLFLIEFKVGPILGIPALILFILIGSMELSSGRAIWHSELGSWRTIMITALLVIMVRIITIALSLPGNFQTDLSFLTTLSADSIIFYASIILMCGELVACLYLYRHSELFMSSMPATTVLGTANSVKTLSECPACHEVVEAYWQSCPYCGTHLPRTCAGCGSDLGEMLMKCPHCGMEVMESVSLKKTIASFRVMAQEDALPETRATRQARLAEALLKNGNTEEAIAAYREAITFTRFPRKRTNFMVQAARILKNTGRQTEALSLLDEAMRLDPADYAGAAKLKAEIKPA